MTLVPQFDSLAFNEQSLRLRAYRQQVLGSNMANADTPNYKARDIDFASVLRGQMTGASTSGGRLALAATAPAHFRGAGSDALGEPEELLYRQPLQPSLDGNTVDADTERTHFSQNAMMTQAAIEFFGGSIRSRVQAFTGQPG